MKNKVAPPFATAEFDLMHDTGINKTAEILDLGAQLDIVKKRGAFYSYQDLKLGQGRDKSIEFLLVNLELRDEIEKQIREFAQDADNPILQFSSEDDEDDDNVEYQRMDGAPTGLDLDDDDDEDDEDL